MKRTYKRSVKKYGAKHGLTPAYMIQELLSIHINPSAYIYVKSMERHLAKYGHLIGKQYPKLSEIYKEWF